jgi:hypothetical protein
MSTDKQQIEIQDIPPRNNPRSQGVPMASFGVREDSGFSAWTCKERYDGGGHIP